MLATADELRWSAQQKGCPPGVAVGRQGAAFAMSFLITLSTCGR